MDVEELSKIKTKIISVISEYEQEKKHLDKVIKCLKLNLQSIDKNIKIAEDKIHCA